MSVSDPCAIAFVALNVKTHPLPLALTEMPTPPLPVAYASTLRTTADPVLRHTRPLPIPVPPLPDDQQTLSVRTPPATVHARSPEPLVCPTNWSTVPLPLNNVALVRLSMFR